MAGSLARISQKASGEVGDPPIQSDPTDRKSVGTQDLSQSGTSSSVCVCVTVYSGCLYNRSTHMSSVVLGGVLVYGVPD